MKKHSRIYKNQKWIQTPEIIIKPETERSKSGSKSIEIKGMIESGRMRGSQRQKDQKAKNRLIEKLERYRKMEVKTIG